MFDAQTGFKDVDPARSAKIFRELSSGKVITRETYKIALSDFIENDLYTVLFKHLEHFKIFYQHLGYELVFNDVRHFFYIRKLTDEEDRDYNRNAFKIQSMLLILGRYFAQSGRHLKYLEDPTIGIRASDIAAIKAVDEYMTMLKGADFKDGPDAAIPFLKDRGFLFEVGDNRYIVSPAGMYFLDVLVDHYGSEMQESTDADSNSDDESNSSDHN